MRGLVFVAGFRDYFAPGMIFILYIVLGVEKWTVFGQCRPFDIDTQIVDDNALLLAVFRAS